ncbi:MAG: PrsW family intramembrane metalloprotease [Bacteroidaceae bacterium]|nr:PrsW family intramembrane metalloprotease [Bacteroidaceae bacterium]
MLPIISVFPILLYLLILKLLDSFALAKWTRLATCFVYGILCCALLLVLTRYVRWSENWISPVLEEILKGGIVLFIILRKKIRFLAEALIYGAAAGGGFSLLENIIYLAYNSEMLTGTAVCRGFGVAIMHMGCVALTSVLLLLFLQEKNRLWVSILSFLPSIGIHFVHNVVQLNPTIHLVVTLLLFLGLFLFLFSYGDKKIYNWMDHSISIDVTTLSAIRQGNFAATNAGKYLLNVKEQVRPEVFFDMICCVQIHLELKIAKQSQMLLKQAGFPIEEKPEDVAKRQELQTLHKQIGKIGNWLLAPIMN